MRNLAVALLALSLSSVCSFAETRNPADYTLRLHIYKLSSHSHRRHGVLEFVNGDGRANLFEGGEPHGVDFAFRCGEHFMTSSGYETYLARWKKPDRQISILLHRIGHDSFETCDLDVDIKNFAYVNHGAHLTTEPVSAYREWMVRSQYDPENGLEAPTGAIDPAYGDVPSRPDTSAPRDASAQPDTSAEPYSAPEQAPAPIERVPKQ